MLNLLLPILPSLGLLIMMILGYFIFRTKVNEYNQKFSSMFSLLSAMTDEIKKLKQMKIIENNVPFVPIEVDNNDVNENDSDYSTEDEYESEEEVDESGYQHDVESDNDVELEQCEVNDTILLNKTSYSQDEVEQDQNETEGKDEDEEEDEKEDIVSYNVEEALDNNKEITIHEENLDYNKMSMKELKSLAKSKGLGGDNNSKLKKQDLIELLSSNTVVLE